MPVTFRNSSPVTHAITDLYDEQRRTFLIQYPIWFILAISLTGVAAFAMTGYFGYTEGEPLRQPWLLFLWFCALLVTLQVSIFRNQSLRSRLIATLIVTAVAILFIGITYFSKSLPDILREWLSRGRFLRTLAGAPLTYTVINFLIIGIFWADTVRRWMRRARGLPPTPRVDIGLGGSGSQTELPSMQELISGDLIAGAVLTLVLALVFRETVLTGLIHPQGVEINTCTLSWPIGGCRGGAGMTDPPTLSFIDLIQTLIYLPLGLLILALSATVSGLGALQGVNAREEHDPDFIVAERAPGTTSTRAVAADVTDTVIDTLRAALDRRIRMLLANLALSIRYIGWLVLPFFAVYGLAELSTGTQGYLHSAKQIDDVVTWVLPAIAWGAIAVIGLVVSAALMLFRWRVVENTMRFLGLIGFIVLLTFWIFSLALWGFNQLLLLTHASGRHPFDPPSFMTVISAGCLAIFAIIVFFRRMRPHPPRQTVAATREPQPAAVPSANEQPGG